MRCNAGASGVPPSGVPSAFPRRSRLCQVAGKKSAIAAGDEGEQADDAEGVRPAGLGYGEQADAGDQRCGRDARAARGRCWKGFAWRGRRRGAFRTGEPSGESEPEEEGERGEEDDGPGEDGDDDGDLSVVAGGRLLDGEVGEEARLLGERPASDGGGDGERCAVAGGLEAAPRDESARRDARKE